MTKQSLITSLLIGIGFYILLKTPDVQPGNFIAAGSLLIGAGVWRELGGRTASWRGIGFTLLAVVAGTTAWAAFVMPNIIFYLALTVSCGGMYHTAKVMRERANG
jgi:hypothetical protein